MFKKSAEFYDAIYSWKDYEKESRWLIKLIAQHKKSPGNSLLDVACGTGAHIPFLRKEFTIEALDLDQGMLKIARRKHSGVRFHHGDMTRFELKQEFDVVTCLFSSIGYVKTVTRLRQAIANMARHLRPGGVLIVEPWLSPEAWQPGHVSALFVDRPELKIARINRAERRGKLSIFKFHYLVGTKRAVRHFTELHEAALFTHAEYTGAFEAAGLRVSHDPKGLMGRGLYVGVDGL